MRRTEALEPSDREGVRTEGASAVQPKAAAAAAAANTQGTKSMVHSMAEDSGRGEASCDEQPAPEAELNQLAAKTEVESKDQCQFLPLRSKGLSDAAAMQLRRH